ncbi:MAG: heavy metal translocating P-type ATPase [Thermoplasmata archaeon]|nr:heavy metal translocating P-type ATPase [Euryarchaeota archaeon]MVT35660.1 heavy metal translocating P-type ATPase [Euryarchaeota archaeon]
MAKDPICGMYVEEREDAIKSIRFGKTYYFCSESCKEQFEKPEKEFKTLKKKIIISWTLTIPVLFFTYFPIYLFTKYIVFILATVVQFYSGSRFYRGTLDAIKNKIGNMDTLISLGTTVAWLFSTIVTFFPNIFLTKSIYFDTSTVIITLVLTGTYMEHLMKRRARDAVEKLISIQPDVAHVIIENRIQDVPVEKVKEGDIILVKPGEKFPTDSIIIEGITEVDESMITGESRPVIKKVGDEVIGGTLNRTGSVKIKAIRVGEDTTLSKIINIVEMASTERVPIQRLADVISSIFVPIVIIAGLSSFIFWYFIGKIGLTFSLLVLVSILIIACPCAMGIATPAALIVSSGRAASNGIIFKNGESIEKASKIDTIILDKTGTLTKGEPELGEIFTFNYDEQFILKLAAIAEIHSEHPFGKAILNKFKGVIEFPEKFEYFPGLGVKVIYRGKRIIVGNKELIKSEKIPFDKYDYIEKIEKNGGTALLVAYDQDIVGIISIYDNIKEGAEEAIRDLKLMNMDIYMVTGDNELVARIVANKLNIEKFYSNVKPEEKLKIIEDLQKKNRKVAMVGDGINDSPALAKADLGIAMGGGTDIAKETGDVIIINNDPKNIAKVFKLAKKTMSKIKQNLAWAFLYNIILIPIAGGLLIPFYGPEIYNILPFLAAIAMAFSSTTVVSNSLLLKRVRL